MIYWNASLKAYIMPRRLSECEGLIQMIDSFPALVRCTQLVTDPKLHYDNYCIYLFI